MMVKQIRFLIGLILVWLMAGPVLAQGPVRPQHTDPEWQASYWNNIALTGTPALQRTDPHLTFDWGSGSPASSVSADRFSARWLRYMDVTPGTYQFTATADDGIRLWVDDELLIDQWHDHPATTYHAQKYLGYGHHLLKVEYYENWGDAVAKISWQQASQPIVGWRGEYYNNKSLSGYPVLVRDDAQINFQWGYASPAPGLVDADGFSVRWSLSHNFPAGHYRFTMTVDDGARLFVNGHLLIDAWKDQPATTHIGDIYLPGGAITMQMEYYENMAGAVAQLTWGPPGEPSPAPLPSPAAIIVDDADDDFVRGGSTTGWRSASGGQRGQMTWTRNNDQLRPNYNWSRWYPTLSPGQYEVFVFIPAHYDLTTSARYWIASAGGFSLQVVDMSRHQDQWVSLGTYTFQGGGSEYVSLSDLTYEPYLSHTIAFDAVKWEPR